MNDFLICGVCSCEFFCDGNCRVDAWVIFQLYLQMQILGVFCVLVLVFLQWGYLVGLCFFVFFF